MLHRPDLELQRLTPRNNAELLFDDVPWVKRARQEHDAFADALHERGVEVLYLEDLLAETLDVPAARDEVLDATIAAVALGPMLAPAAASWLTVCEPPSSPGWLIGGMTCDELPVRAAVRSAAQVPRADAFVLAAAAEPPLHARHVALDLRRRVAEPDGQAGPPARDRPPRRRSTDTTRCSPATTFEIWSGGVDGRGASSRAATCS